ncbi:hypothetical protein AB0F81_06195 [Actinoplanes sp. NPDC024001]|uniref:hypothetical protein n=1 Tax=Actinoplanes sp. NPDC024001 TaxID=3154598 RepID=UPI0033D80CCE
MRLLSARLFDDRWDRRVITTFARRVVERLPDGATIVPRHVEVVVRGLLGETELFGDADHGEEPEIFLDVLFAMVDELGLDDAAVHALLADAEEQAARAEGLCLGPDMDGDTVPDGGRWRRTRRRYLTDDDFVARRPATLRRPRLFIPGDGPQPYSKAGRYLRGLTLRRPELGPPVEDVPNHDLLLVTRTALVAAAPRYFNPDPDIAEIAALARETRKTYGSELDLMKGEYLARTALNETVPLDGITSRDVYLCCTLLVCAIADWWSHNDAAVCAVIVDAEEYVARRNRLAR